MSNFNSVSVPASREGGVRSGVMVETGEVFTINASGRANYGHRDLVTYPDGSRFLPSGYAGARVTPGTILEGVPVGLLIARVAEGPWMMVGASQTLASESDGEVILAYNDKPGHYKDNSGEYQTTIENHGRVGSEAMAGGVSRTAR